MKKSGIILMALTIVAGPMLFASGEQDAAAAPKEMIQANPVVEPAYMAFEGTHKDVWRLEVSDPLLIGGYGDNFVYDGKAVVPVAGKASVNVDAEKNEGSMIAEFYGTITP